MRNSHKSAYAKCTLAGYNTLNDTSRFSVYEVYSYITHETGKTMEIIYCGNTQKRFL